LEYRNKNLTAPRDNVIFESGMFIGAIGAERVFLVASQEQTLKLPTDLAGVSKLIYHSRKDGRLSSATATACRKIEERVSELGALPRRDQTAPYAAAVCYREATTGIELLLIKSTRNRWIVPKGVVLAGESSPLAALRDAEDEGGINGRIEIRETRRFRTFKEDRGEEQLVDAHLIKTKSEGLQLEAFRSPTWFKLDDALDAVTTGRPHKYSEGLRSLLIWAHQEAENNVADKTFLAGALPYKKNKNGEIEFLLITSRTSRNWIAPKGHLNAGERPEDAANREAKEEGGIFGKISTTPIGSYRYRRLSKDYVVDLYPLKVSSEAVDWPEMNFRQRRWFDRNQAAEIVNEVGLSRLIFNFSP